MKKFLFFIIIFCLSVLTACSNASNDSDINQGMTEESVERNAADNDADFVSENGNDQSDQADTESETADQSANDSGASKRKVIYTADLQVEVKDYQESFADVEAQIESIDGYIVESNVNEDEENGAKNGHLTARIPQEDFKEFIKIVEEGSSKVLNSSTSGEDVTEEYVDLESRLKSKEVVEERLLSFMEEADKTEDLLKISDDLATVQEEIEELTGRMKYLDDKSDLATVSINMQEKNVTLSGTGKDQLNTWEKTKQQFMNSSNFLITAFSGVFVFIVGNLPLFILFGVIGFLVFLIVKRKMRNQKKNE